MSCAASENSWPACSGVTVKPQRPRPADVQWISMTWILLMPLSTLPCHAIPSGHQADVWYTVSPARDAVRAGGNYVSGESHADHTEKRTGIPLPEASAAYDRRAPRCGDHSPERRPLLLYRYHPVGQPVCAGAWGADLHGAQGFIPGQDGVRAEGA